MIQILLTCTRRILLLGTLVSCLSTAWAQEYQNGIRKGMVKVKFSSSVAPTLSSIPPNAKSKPTTGIASFDAVAKKTSATSMYRLFPYDPRHESKLKKHGLDLWYVVEIEDHVDPKVAIAEFKQLGEVSVAEVDREKILAPYQVQEYRSSISTSSILAFNDPLLKDQWHYDNTGQTGFANGADINLFEAWKTTTGSREIIVSVHDQGVDVNHPDLAANIWTNTDELNGTTGVDDDGNGYIDDIHGWNFDRRSGSIDPQFHGTHVAGTIAAVNNNGIGVSGVAGGSGNNDGVRIMSLQSLGGGRLENTFVYAANNGAVISQNSWGYNDPGTVDQAILDAINYFIAEAGDYPGSPMKGGVVIFAAGNSNWDANWYPGYYENTIAVSAIGPDWKKTGYSNYGTWVDIAAPGGNTSLGPKNGVLSTLPNNKYGYMDGTSMACPHVSGVAALVLANRTSQLTPEILWTKLLTGVVDINSHNPDHEGKLGTGLLDAFLAIQNNEGIAPNAITNLSIVGIAQEFATIKWGVPADEDDGQPVNFKVLILDKPITSSNISEARQITISNKSAVGETINFSAEGLLGKTQYYFAVVSADRWNNISALSNVVTATTNNGPAIAVDENSQTVTLNIDVNTATTASQDITILNNAEGLLRWEYFARHKDTELSFSSVGLKYPQVKNAKIANLGKVRSLNIATPTPSSSIAPMSFEQIYKRYTSYDYRLIGEEDLTLTNSSATRFVVNEDDGFNLTRVQMLLKHDPDLGPMILEVYKGSSVTKQNLIYAQEYTSTSDEEENASIDLTEQLYFEKGDTFWIVFHAPAGNKYPLGIGYEVESEDSKNCYMSFDMGKTWTLLERVLTTDEGVYVENHAWSTVAYSMNEHLGQYIALSPSSGEIIGMGNGITNLSADATTLINGTYKVNVVLASNDAEQQELRIPVTVNVSGHKPELSSVETVDFSSVFSGASKELTVTISNTGLGNYNDAEFQITNPRFEIVSGGSTQLMARSETALTIRYTPGGLGNDNGLLKITSASNADVLNIILFGVSTPPAAISVTPLTQTINNLTIGDEATATVTIENTGQAALKYFVPGFDQSGVSENWTEEYHSYGYNIRTNFPEETNPLAYSFQDISTTGENITAYFKEEDNRYWELDMGFAFPYYKDKMEKLYISSRGFTTFSPDVNPINTPSLNNPWNPKGYISILGQVVDLSFSGEIFYKVETDRVIVQYNAIGESYAGVNTAQMVLHSDGNIRFYYENIGHTNTTNMNILIEDFDQTDGILINDWQGQAAISSGVAIGFDYPGPNIITSISNADGILMPGETANLNVVLNTLTVSEGELLKAVNIISNDPIKSQEIAQVKLNVVDGGVADVSVSTNEITFGDVFQGATASRKFIIKNNGTAAVTLTNVTLDNDNFIINGNTAAVLKPGLGVALEVVLPTGVKTSLTDVLHITDSEGTAFAINLSGNVVDAPAILTDLTPIVETLAHGETSSYPITFENTGLADLEVVATGTQWLTMEKNMGTTSSTPDYTYTSKLYNDGSNYHWLDIRKTGQQLPFVTTEEEFFNPELYWRKFELPRPVSFYGKNYSTIYIAENGLVSFHAQEELPFDPYDLPTQTDFKTILAPYWMPGGFNIVLYPKEEVGLFVQSDDEKIVISWEYLINNQMGFGDPISAQVIFYNNGTMKFQYKVNGWHDGTTNLAMIGMQNEDRSDAVTINPFSSVTHGNGLAYIITPAEKHVLAPGATLEATIKINTESVYAGTYQDGLTIRTNAPNMESLFKPVELTVTGEAVMNTVESIDFGSMITYETEDGPAGYTKEFTIKNLGIADLSLSGMYIQSNAPGYLLEMYVYDSMWDFWYWTNVYDLWELPTIKPGDEIRLRITNFPTTTGDVAENLVINSSLGETIIPISGTVVLPPTLSINTENIYSEVRNLTDTDTQVASIDNAEGQSALTYSLRIDYNRVTATSLATGETVATQASPSIPASVNTSASRVSPLSTHTVFNRVLAHENATVPTSYLGYSGQYDFKVATRFNAGSEGFNVTHIQTYYRAPEAMHGTVDYEVRAGGSSIAEAEVLSQGTYTYSYSGGETGSWLEIPLVTSATIYPNEDFYIIINYPMILEHPQGYIEDQGATPGRYQYFYEGTWYDIQEGIEGVAFLMRAAEETFVSNTWVNINGETEGTIEAGQSLDIQLDFKAVYGERGDQFATLVINTNDPVNSTGEIPVTLHVNEGPRFIGVPSTVRVFEGATKIVTIQLNDIEDDDYVITPKQSYPGITHSLTDETLIITLAPGYDDAGTYSLVFEGKDELNAVSSMTMQVDVINANRSPEFIGEETMSFNANGQLNEYNIEDYFSDPDGDELTFTLTNSNSESLEVFTSGKKFMIRPLVLGEAKLAFAVTDSYGAVTHDTITILIDVVLGEEDLINSGLGVYPNPAVGIATVTLSNDWAGMVEVVVSDATGRKFLTQSIDANASREVNVDVSKLSKGIYMVSAISGTKRTTHKLIKK